MAKAPTKPAKPAAKPAKASAKPAAAEKKAPRVPQEKHNGVSRPSAGTATGNVWAIAEAIQKRGKGKSPARADVLAACEADGINPATAATQFGKWCRFNGLTQARPVVAAAKEKPTSAKKPAGKKGKAKADPDPVEEEEEEEEE